MAPLDRPGGARAGTLELRGVTKRYPGARAPAVDDLSLTVPAGALCVLIGPSGCGKTTALKTINRLIEPTGGQILIDGADVRAQRPAELRRRIGYVIQQVGLLPHLTVAANVATVPRLLGWERERVRARVRELLALVGLPEEEYGRRYPAELSGGQQQRVGLARALAGDPALMLMDEPFSAVDPITRARLQEDFLRLHRAVPKTVVLVSHDIDEAIRLADLIAVMRDGRLVQCAPPAELLARPADDFVAGFVGADRALRRLGLTRLADIALAPPAGPPPPGTALPRSATLRQALSALLEEGVPRAAVVDEEGRVVGAVGVEEISAALRAAAEAPVSAHA
jgi:osmoprotectant transport system ATP-binding protein